MQWETAVSAYGSARQPPELMHYGIPHMRWGVRRYQNEDGTLTPAGKERYNKNSEGREKKKKDPNARENWKAKDAKDLSDEELRRRNNRLQQERNYRDNTTPQWKKDVKQFAKNNVQEAVKNILIGTAITALAGVMLKNYKKAGPVISKAARKTLSQIKSSRNAVRESSNRYSHQKAPTDGYRMNLMALDKVHRSSSGSRSQRQFSYKPGSHYGVGKSQDWPSMNVKGNKSGKKTNGKTRG